MRILSVFGTRPEAIKMAPIVMALRALPGVESRVCVTGQHRRMLDDTLNIFGVQPDDDLDIMTGDQTLADISARVLTGLDPIMRSYRPNYVLVQGDTATSTAAALSAFFNKVKVGHVEAGLRTGDMASPWPEEANRRVTAVVTNRHYAPTEKARRALLSEGYSPSTIMVTGNTVIDALLHVADEVTAPGPLRDRLDQRFDWIDPSRRMILVTGHRRESFGDGFVRICTALREIARRDDVQIIYPVHLNPNVRQPVFEYLAASPNVSLIEPQDYQSFVYLMTRSTLILTDSGGVQEEAPALGKPVLVMRDTSERMEAIEAGVARLVSTDPKRILRSVTELLDNRRSYAAMATGANPFGDGKASARIVADLLASTGAASPMPIPAFHPAEVALAVG